MEEIKVGMSTKEFTENLEVFNNTGEHIENPKEGDYVRTIDGYIRRIFKVNTERKAITYSGTYILDEPYKNSKSMARNKIIKFSSNIIDLIEVGDYVNGNKIIRIDKDPFIKGQINLWIGLYEMDSNGDRWRIKYTNNEIKSIVTKEQFENIEYRLED